MSPAGLRGSDSRRAAALMPETDGSIVTLTYMGSERAIPN